MASPAYREASTIDGSDASSAVVSKPTGTADGDILIVSLYIESTATVSTVPSGWAEKTSVTSNNSSFIHRTYWKRASSEGTDWTWSWTGSAWRGASCIAISGAVASGDPVDVFDSDFDTDTGDSTTPAVSGTTTVADTLLVWSGASYYGGTWTAPTNFTKRSDATVTCLATLAQAGTGDTGSLTGSYSGSTGYSAAALFAIKPAGATQSNAPRAAAYYRMMRNR